jgi:hypothetical protein
MSKINFLGCFCFSLIFLILIGCSTGINDSEKVKISESIDSSIKTLEAIRITKEDLYAKGIPKKKIVPIDECKTSACMNETSKIKTYLMKYAASKKAEIGHAINLGFIDIYSTIAGEKITETKFELILKKIPSEYHYIDEIRVNAIGSTLMTMLTGAKKGQLADTPDAVVDDVGGYIDSAIAALNELEMKIIE